MRYRILSLYLAFIMLQAAMPSLAGAGPGATNGAIHPEWPELDFTVAYDDFTKGDFAAASLEIRKGADFLNTIAERSAGKIKEDLLRSNGELGKLSDDIEKGTAKSPTDLRKAFSHAHQALAEYYHARLKDSWLKKDTEMAGRELRSALSNLEHSISWYGGEAEEKAAKVIKELRELVESLTKKSEWIAEEIDKAIKEIQEELNKLQGQNSAGEKKK